MSKILPANSTRNLSINSGSAWARGPPTSATANNSQPVSTQAPSPAPASGPSNQSAAARVNGQASHSRRPSAALGSNLPSSPTTLKDPVAVSKSVAAPIPTKAASVQFGSIDDSNAILSTSPAVPPAVADPKQIKTFGSISAGSGETMPASPAVSKTTMPSRTDSPAPANKPKKKLDVNSLFQKPLASSASAASSSSSQPVTAPPPQANQQQPTSGQAPTPPIPQTPQDGPGARPVPKTQPSYDSPSSRTVPLPIVSQSSNQTHQGMQPGSGPNSYHFTPPAHFRQSTNGGPGANPPRSPGFNRTMTNGNMRGPPGVPGSGGLGSPRMGPPPSIPASAPTAPQQTPMAGMPPNMMNQPSGPVGHPPHMPSPVNQVPPGQMQPQMGMPQMWSPYYYPPHYDPNVPPPFYWQPSHLPQHMMPPQHATPQQTPISMPPSSLPTPSQAPMPMPMSPRVPPSNATQAPATPASPHPSLAHAPPGSRSSFIATKRPVSIVSIKRPDGEKVDVLELSKKKADDAAVAAAPKKDEPERRPGSTVRIETEEAHKKRIEEEKAKDKVKKEDDLRKLRAKRDAEARERAKRDQEEKERRQRELEDADRKKNEDKEQSERSQREAEDAEKARVQREAEEAERAKKEEEEKELKRKEEEEKELKRKEEEEEARRLELESKKRQEEEAARRKAEEDRKREEDEAARKEEARKQEEEQARQKALEEEEKLRAEAAQKAKVAAEEAARQREKEKEEAAAAAAAAATQSVDSNSQASTPLGSTPAHASPALSASALPKSALPPSLDPKRRPIPGRLDLSSTTSASLPQPLPSALASARIIEDIGKVSYPEGIKAPSSELNMNAQSGKFRYDRDFLMQFMKVCKEKPDDMPSLDAIGLEPSDQQGSFPGRRGRAPIPTSAGGNRGPGLGLSGPGGTPKIHLGGGMGQFQAPRSSEERFAASIPRAGPGAIQFPRQALGRTNSTTGLPLQGIGGRRDTPQRTHSGRGSKRTDSKVGQPPSGMQHFTSAEPELHHAGNSWSATRKPSANDTNSPEFIDRKVKALLNKLTLEKFDSISAQILEWANRSVNEVDGRTLIQVIRLVFEKATDEATWSEMYARLCRFLMERISQEVRDEGIKNADGKPIAGGNLFRKYLLNRCQEDFERGWSQREAAMLAAANKAEDDKAAAAAADKAGTGEEVLYSDEYYASQKAKRRGLGLVKFIGELFKLQMLTERIMHECIKKLLSNVENPEEEEIESLCKLLATVGQALDTPKARNHMDIYFSRMLELANSGQISSRIQFMLLDIIELRKRSWVTRTQVAAPTTIAEVHQKAERDRQVAEREAALRQAGGRDHLRGSRRDTRDYGGPPQVGADGWTTPAARPAPKAGDLSNFGKISKPTTMAFGPSSVFSKKERRESGSVTRASSSSNMFAALNSSEATPDAVSVGSRTANSTRPPSRKASIDFSASSVVDTPQRRRLLLQPRTHNLASDAGSVKDDAGSAIGQSDMGDDDAASAAASTSAAGGAAPQMTMEQAKRKIKEDIKELFMLRQLSEADGYFSSLPAEFRWCLVEELVHKAVDGRANDVKLIADVFDLVATKSLVDEEQFSAGFGSDLEYLEDTSTDSPNAYANIATVLKAAKLSQTAVERLADKIIVEGEMAVTPREKLLAKYAAAST